MDKIDKKLTIVMAVYNKENLIKRAIDSILCQETDYLYKIVIIDDCSSDGSQIVIEEYKKQYPNIIEFHQNKKNMRYFGAVLTGCKKITTPYWTVLDPDDYWTDKKHLNDAVEFLENNEDYALYASNAMMLSDTGKEMGVISPLFSCPNYSLKTSDICPYTHTSATFYRNYYTPTDIADLKKYINTPYEKVIEGDSFRNFWHLNKGKGFYCSTIKSVYEVDQKGIYSILSDIQKDILNAKLFYFCYLFFDKNIEFKFLKTTHFFLRKIYSSLAFIDLDQKVKNEVFDLSNIVFFINKECSQVVPVNIIREKQNKRYYLFKFIPILNVKYRKNICRVYIFGFIPILKIRYK
ncbi:hypothetical protein MEG_00297 [Bartonella tamiae Th307]|uniref:Glycosyltransferase 2-like domain-containing protein n=2 Tax=Bartonella tamiae TaxID=373638 RepID=J0R0J8_9HYPH|nr:hypothetical protein ME5_01585 [Bartonella tamiae Th239]EJF94716.1 hypothetical protein MEG_00297 [Bartonella tamiae Th307]